MGSRLYGYNSGAPVSGASQSGNLAISNDSKGGGSVQWYNGPNEDLGYVIGYPDTTGTRKVGGVTVGNAVGFMRTSSKTDAEFLSLANFLTSQGFMTASVAANWLNTNGYYTSYSTDPTFTLVMNLDSTTGVTGSTWTDISGGGHNATLNGGYGTTTFNSNQVVTLNGSSGYVLPSSFGTQLSTGFTNNVWVYPTTTSNGIIISEWGGTPPNGWTDAQIALVSGRIRGGVFDPGNFSPTGYITGPTFSANTWYNIAMTYNSTTKDLMLYINGTLNSTINGLKLNPGTLYLTLGRTDGVGSYLGGATGYFQGYVGSWKIWNGPISATNILSNYNSTKSIYGL